MSIYDISDVAYDAFLLNGHPKTNPWTAPVQIGDTVRLRFIGAGGSTIRKGKVESADLDVFYWHLISEFWAIKGDANYFYKPSRRPY